MVKLRLDLREPSMTCLHRAGVAGLFAQLKYLEDINCHRPYGFEWWLTAHTIELNWMGTDRDVIEWLCGESFQIDSDGLIYFPAIANSWNFRRRLFLQNSLRKTFLQHNKFFKSGAELTKIDGEREIKYKSCQRYAHQKGADFLCGKEKKKDDIQSKPIEITGWIYPGGTVKHYALGKATQLVETAANFFALLFAPLTCGYVGIITDLDPDPKSKTFLTGLVIPEIANLEKYYQSRNPTAQSEYYYRAAGWAEAGLRFLLQTTPAQRFKQREILRCQVISFGVVAWSKQQHTRISVESIAIDTDNLARYQKIDRLLRGQNSFTNPLLQFIAANLIRGKPWWWDFADTFDEKAYRAVKPLQQQLNLMVKQTQWDNDTQKLFVQVCHQALKITFAKIYSRTKEGYYPQIERELLQLRLDLERCHNAAAFRDFITGFWGKAGTIKILQDRWEEMLPLTTGTADWKVGKSLVLLALASYKPDPKPTDGEQDRLISTDTEGES